MIEKTGDTVSSAGSGMCELTNQGDWVSRRGRGLKRQEPKWRALDRGQI